MKVPMKVDYGVRALVELALRYGSGQVQTAEIALKRGIPEAYLDQLMTNLNKVGFVNSRRGPQGGHVLAMEPSKINLSMITNALDGNTSPLECFIHPDECMFSDNCAQQEIWKSVEDAVHNLLTNITLADLLQRQRHLTRREAAKV